MTYQALARKWRPNSLQEVAGQSAIIRILTQALLKNRLHHAYLFTGTRGVGKTTIARILAKCLNCEKGVTPTPCGTCANCEAITNGRFLDLYEIDAASRTKVEDTRDLLENVAYPPVTGRYKIYLIDEVHMLSQHSFNALLKTLEEPPEHVKFLLATTDPKKLPATVLSRCLQFHLKPLSLDTITTRLTDITNAEDLASDQEALRLIAKAAKGSMRDALSLLDQAIAFGSGNVYEEEVKTMLGDISQSDVIGLLKSLSQHDGNTLFSLLNRLLNDISDANAILEETISILHEIAMNQIVPQTNNISSDLQDLIKTLSPETVQLYYQIALLGRRDLGLAPSEAQGLEMVFLRMLAFTLPAATKLVPDKQSEKTIQVEKPTVVAATNDWRAIVDKLGLSGMAQMIAANCNLTKMSDKQIQLTLSKEYASLLNDKLKERIQDVLSQYFSRSIELTITISEKELMTPAKQVADEKIAEKQAGIDQISRNPLIKHFLEHYDTTLDITMLSS